MFFRNFILDDVTLKKEIREKRLTQKSPTLVAVLNLIIPGTGFMYMGLFLQGFAVVLLSLIFYFILFVFPGVILAVCMFLYSFSYVNRYNELVFDVYNENKTDHERLEKEEQLRFKCDEFKEKLTKSHNLLRNQILSEEEYNLRKAELINSIRYKKISEDPDDLLTQFVELKQKGMISTEEIQSIKQFLYGEA